MLGELTGEDEADGSLDLARGKSGLLVDASELLLKKGERENSKYKRKKTRSVTVLLPRSGKIDLLRERALLHSTKKLSPHTKTNKTHIKSLT